MTYPYSLKLKVEKIFGNSDVEITLHSGLTTFVGTNASGKTQTLKALRDKLKEDCSAKGEKGDEKVRYLSSNRIGNLEQYRSKTDRQYHSEEALNLGDKATRNVRHKIETANGAFFILDSRKDIYIKVAERLSILFGRNIFLRWDSGNLKVFFSKTDAEEEYSIAAEASGLVNIISILTALFDDSIEFLLIDEPEVSLHPQLQSFLLQEIKRTAETRQKAIIISTHSTEMIELDAAEDLCNFVFFNGECLPKQISTEDLELKDGRIIENYFLRNGDERVRREVVKNFILRMDKAVFFAKKVLLVEGSSDMILCRYLCNRLRNRLQLNLDAAGSQIIPVEGKGQFRAIRTLLFHLMGKEICVLTDLDGFTDDNEVTAYFSNLPRATEITFENHRYGDLEKLIKNVKDDIDKTIAAHAADMKEIYESHPYWVNHEKEMDENNEDKLRDKTKDQKDKTEDKTEDKKNKTSDKKAIPLLRRAITAQLFSTDDGDLERWPDYTEWKALKAEISKLLDTLERLGCFVLRKGTIECYYSFAPKDTYSAKPSAAVEETDGLNEYTDEQVCSNYGDLIRALQYAAGGKTVDESRAVRQELYSELALVLGILKENPTATEKDFRSAIKQRKNSAESLFEYALID